MRVAARAVRAAVVAVLVVAAASLPRACLGASDLRSEETSPAPTSPHPEEGSGPPKAPRPHGAPEQIHLALADSNASAVVVTWLTFGHGSAKGSVSHNESQPEHVVAFRRALTVLGVRFPWTFAPALSRTYRVGNWEEKVFEGQLHHALLTALVPGVSYEYRVGSQKHDLWSDLFQFEMPVASLPASPKDAADRVAVFGDMGLYKASYDVARALDNDLSLRMVLHLGDFSYAAYEGNERWDITKLWYARVKEDSWNQWARLMQPVTARMPYMVLPGNHETDRYDDHFIPFYHRFPLPPHITLDSSLDGSWLAPFAPPLPSEPPRLYYSFQHLSAHIVMLNSEGGGFTASAGSQLQWLERDLAAAAAPSARRIRPWIIVCLHRPLYSSGTDGSNMLARTALEPMLAKYRVSIVFSGHDHSYERTYPITQDGHVLVGDDGTGPREYVAPEGTIHVRVGTGGIPVSDWPEARPAPWTLYRELSHGYGRLNFFANNSLMFEFLRVPPGATHGKITDYFWLHPRVASPEPVIEETEAGSSERAEERVAMPDSPLKNIPSPIQSEHHSSTSGGFGPHGTPTHDDVIAEGYSPARVLLVFAVSGLLCLFVLRNLLRDRSLSPAAPSGVKWRRVQN